MTTTNDKKAKKRYEGVYKIPIMKKTDIQNTKIPGIDIQNIEISSNVPVEILACEGTDVIVTPKNLYVDDEAFSISLTKKLTKEFDNTLCIDVFYNTPDENASLTVEIPAKSISEPYSLLSVEAINTEVTIRSFIFVKELDFLGLYSKITSYANFKTLYIDDLNYCDISIKTCAKQDLKFNIHMYNGTCDLQLDNVSDCTRLTYRVGRSNYDTKALEKTGPYKATGTIFVENDDCCGID